MESDSEEEPPYDMNDLDDEVDLAFDIQRLPHVYGTKTTETIIEALFNPVKITDMQYESPFTIYEPPPVMVVTETTKKSTMNGIGLGLSGAIDRNASINNNNNNNKRQNSDASSSFYHYSTGSSSTSLHTTTTTSGRSKESGSGGPSSRHGSIREARGVGEVVEDLTATATISTFGGVRGWWKRHTTRPETPATARV